MSTPKGTLRRTPLTAWHEEARAKMAPFAGFSMPIQYSSILREHAQTRDHASVFDICHMGEFLLMGKGATEALSGIVTHNLSTLRVGRCRYGFLLNEAGCVLDDLIVYRLAEERYMLVVNGSRCERDFIWISDLLPEALNFADVSVETAKIDLQGPASLDVLETVLPSLQDKGETGMEPRLLPYFGFMEAEYDGETLLISRTGYTGELGFELYIHDTKALALWKALLEDPRVAPAGLGARDTLRLEVGLPLYGQDLDEKHTPAEAGYAAMLKNPEKHVGKGKDHVIRERLIGLSLEGRRAARHDDVVCLPSGQEVGRVTSGAFAPSLGHPVALAYVNASHADEADFVVRGARTELPASRTELPFFKHGSARKKLAPQKP